MPEPSTPTGGQPATCLAEHPIYKGMTCALPPHEETEHDNGDGMEWANRKAITYATRPRIAVEPVDPANPKAGYTARCEDCGWTCGPTAKSWLTGTEMPAHRRAHRAAPKAGA